MEIIKRYLEEFCSDENQIADFLLVNEYKIKDFFNTTWQEQFDITNKPTDKKSVITTRICSIPNIEQNQEPPQAVEVQSQKEITKLDFEEIHDKERAHIDALSFQIKDKQITFKNGKVNQQYDVDFDPDKLGFAEISEVSFEGLEKIGLEYLPKEKKIQGLPIIAGDHKVTMFFKIKSYESYSPLQREVVFIINPDPRVLWSKNIPTPKDIKYYKPDSDNDFIKVESKKTKGLLGFGKKKISYKDMVAASQRGRSHAIEGKPRDDDFALHFEGQTEWYIMAVADGAGSAQFSREGSRIACQTVKNICTSKLIANKELLATNDKVENKNEIGKILQDIIGSAVFESYKAIEKEAIQENTPIKDYATTLILSLCKKFEYGWFVAAWWVGDGGIGIYDKDTLMLKVLGKPDGGEFAGQTRFLTMSEIIRNELYNRMNFEVVEDFTALILMSDGITDPKFETDANLNRIEKWTELWLDLSGNNEDESKVDFTDDNEQTVAQLMKWLDFWSKGNHDDRTIAILF